MTFLIGPNGSGKTAVLQALSRMFAFDPSLRRVQRSDFHVPCTELPNAAPDRRVMSVEAEFILPELQNSDEEHPTIPIHFQHMRLDEVNGIPRVRFRLTAELDVLSGEVEDRLEYVLSLNPDGTPQSFATVMKSDRNNIQVHYLPARRDPSDHIAYTANALLGRVLRSVNWEVQREQIKTLTEQISASLVANEAVSSLSELLTGSWQQLHRGDFFSSPRVTFLSSEVEALLKHMSVSFSPGHDDCNVDFSRLSDGQKSMLYLSLVVSTQGIGREVLAGNNTAFDADKLKPAVFTMVAMEEPENSLSPHYLGRVISLLKELSQGNDAQSLIATHAPAMLRRIDPENIQYLRLDQGRCTKVTAIVIPDQTDEAYKFVREAVQAFPELYFAKLVVLGEGDSEEIVLPRLFLAKGLSVDVAAISIVPLGGRHVNHFWRLLHGLEIPFFTLLDLDLGRFGGGWGRIKYVLDKINELAPPHFQAGIQQLSSPPKWDDDENAIIPNIETYKTYRDSLEALGIFFSAPLDLDFAMLKRFPTAYRLKDVDHVKPDESDIKAILGKNYHGVEQYTSKEQQLFITYHKRFKVGSKPDAHMSALSELDDQQISSNIPATLERMIDVIMNAILDLPE